ncbi:MAG: DsbA family oxidoreductase [Acidobacteriota bacterium]
MEIQIWSDIACPWCWVGKKHIEIALADFDPKVRVVWRAFELNPQAPTTSSGPVDYAQRLADKYRMGRRDAQGFIDRMTQAGRDVGVDMRFDRIRPCNTFNAHRLLAWAHDLGDRGALKEHLFAAYLSEGRDLNDAGTLGQLVSEAGLDGEQAVKVLADGSFGDEVRGDQAEAQRLGITGVPFFVFGHGLTASGAQTPAVLRRALIEALSRHAAESSSSSTDGSSPAACDVDGCA